MPAEVGDIFQVHAVGQAFNQRVMFTHNYRLTAVTAGTAETAARNSLLLGVSGGVLGGDVLESPYLAMLPPMYRLLYWECQVISPVRRTYQRLTRNQLGTHAAECLTVNHSLAISLRGETVGRKSHCTKHIGPTPETDAVMDNGIFAPDYIALGVLLKDSLISEVIDATIGATWTPIIYNPGDLINFTPALYGNVGSTVRVQRRRTVGLGE